MPRIWIPEAPAIVLPGSRYNTVEGLCPPPVQIGGRFSIELVHAATGIVVEYLPPFENMVVDAGLNALAVNGPTQLINYCAVGTGNTAPAAGQISLVTEVSRTNSNGGFADSSGVAADNSYVWYRVTRVFTQAQANGVLTELGMFQNAAGAPMYARQLIKDAGGSATSITKTSDYELRVTYEIRVYTQPTDVVYSALINAVATNITCHSNGHTSWLASLGTPLAPVDNGGTNDRWRAQMFETQVLAATTAAAEAGGVSATTVTSVAAYVAGNFYRDATCEWNGSSANFATGVGHLQTPGIPGSVHGLWFQHQIPNPKPTKTSLQKYVLVQRISWTRYP